MPRKASQVAYDFPQDARWSALILPRDDCARLDREPPAPQPAALGGGRTGCRGWSTVGHSTKVRTAIAAPSAVNWPSHRPPERVGIANSTSELTPLLLRAVERSAPRNFQISVLPLFGASDCSRHGRPTSMRSVTQVTNPGETQAYDTCSAPTYVNRRSHAFPCHEATGL